MKPARTRPLRASEQLTEHECRQLLASAEAARAAGAPHTHLITVDLELAGNAPRDCPAVISGLLKDIQEWIVRRDGPAYWVCVQECGRQAGVHVHILVHVPEAFEPLFSGWLRRRAERRLGKNYPAHFLNIRRLPSPTEQPAEHKAVLREKLQYVLKCAPAEWEARLGVAGWGDTIWGQKGLVYGRRLRRAQVGRAQRRSRREAPAPRPPVDPAEARRRAAMLLALRQPILPQIPHWGFAEQHPAQRRGRCELRVMPRLAKPWRWVALFPRLRANTHLAGPPISEAKAQGP